MLTQLLARPNPFYSGDLLWRATMADFTGDGNAYWIKRRNGLRAPVQLWWAPSWTMEPAFNAEDPTVFITHYTYTVNGSKQELAVVPVEAKRDLLIEETQDCGLHYKTMAAAATSLQAMSNWAHKMGLG